MATTSSMVNPSPFPSHHPFISLLNHCKSLPQLYRIHAHIITHGLSLHPFLVSKLLHFSALSPSADLPYSLLLFHSLPSPNTFIYNTLIRAFSQIPNPLPSISLYTQMLRTQTPPDHLTFPFLAKSCARLSSLPLSTSIHTHIAKSGLSLDRFVQNSLLHMYSSCGDISSACHIFDEIPHPNLVSYNSLLDGYAKCRDLPAAQATFAGMPERDVVSWSAMIDAYVKSAEYQDALALFDVMQGLGQKANHVTMVSVMCACAHLGALDRGREMHRYVRDNGLRMTLPLVTSLVDMYAKCGSMDDAMQVFRGLAMEKTDVLIWNAVIGGLALHGMCSESMELFRLMEDVGIRPDEITYLGLLTACAHGGLVEDAWRLFRSMEAWDMKPLVEHFACMVDVLGRAGRVREAYEFVMGMPMEPSASVLGALLNGCQTHGLVHLGEVVGKRLIAMEPDHDGRYIGLSNVYALAKRWDDAKSMREAMESRGVRKVPGYSIAGMDGALHTFVAHDESHPRSEEIYWMLDALVIQMKEQVDGAIEDLYDRQL